MGNQIAAVYGGQFERFMQLGCNMRVLLIIVNIVLAFECSAQVWKHTLVNEGLLEGALAHSIVSSSSIYTVFETSKATLIWQLDTSFSYSSPYKVAIINLDKELDFNWHKSIQSDSGLTVFDIATDPLNSIYIYGLFDNNLILEDTVVVSPQGNSHYIIKLDSSGSLEFVKTINGQTGDIGHSLNQDRWGSIEVNPSNLKFNICGPIYSNALLGEDSLFISNSDHSSDFYISQLDEDGISEWSKVFSSNGTNLCKIQIRDSSIYASGWSATRLALDDSVLLKSPYFTQTGFIMKLNHEGKIHWAKGAYNVDFGTIAGIDVTINQNGDAFWLGLFNADEIAYDTKLYDGYAGNDIFVAKMDANAAASWFEVIGGYGSEGALMIETLGTNAILSISHGSEVYYKSDTIDAYNFTNFNSTVVALNTNGGVHSYKHIISSSSNEITGLSVFDSILLTSGKVGQGLISFGSEDHYKSTDNNLFLATLDYAKLASIDSKHSEDLSIYPNPAESNLFIKLDNEVFNTIEIELYNSIGQLVLSETLIPRSGIYNIYNIDLSKIPSGSYSLRTSYSNKLVFFKFLII